MLYSLLRALIPQISVIKRQNRIEFEGGQVNDTIVISYHILAYYSKTRINYTSNLHDMQSKGKTIYFQY